MKQSAIDGNAWFHRIVAGVDFIADLSLKPKIFSHPFFL